MSFDRGLRDPPPEIAFLERHGIARELLLRAANSRGA